MKDHQHQKDHVEVYVHSENYGHVVFNNNIVFALIKKKNWRNNEIKFKTRIIFSMK